jgi:hypothetical protein
MNQEISLYNNGVIWIEVRYVINKINIREVRRRHELNML